MRVLQIGEEDFRAIGPSCVLRSGRRSDVGVGSISSTNPSIRAPEHPSIQGFHGEEVWMGETKKI